MASNKQYRGEKRNAAKAFGEMAKKEIGKTPSWQDRWRVIGKVAPHVFAHPHPFEKG
jgi:hypothetical protein